ncbi:MAG: di-trans,poly-cis-decaprenylcistransferase [Alphaproteobacteria bacterium]|nr:di-trans,poly-cis-decaprenylcistransferase [Alphaproteobacteria bacterium]
MTHKPSSNIPKHVAVIMDGNGRWAKKRGLPRSMGHKRGAESAKRIVENAAELNIKYITLFGFSSENWNRPPDEIEELMSLLRSYLRSQTAELHGKNARLSVIGDRSAFDSDIVELIQNAENLTKDNNRIHVIIALNYGGHHDIAQATQKMIENALRTGKTPSLEEIQDSFPQNLLTTGIPDPDLLIRTSGEQRISNFLLYQCAYSELFFTETLWPDFSKKDLEEAIACYARRERRFGALKQSSL